MHLFKSTAYHYLDISLKVFFASGNHNKTFVIYSSANNYDLFSNCDFFSLLSFNFYLKSSYFQTFELVLSPIEGCMALVIKLHCGIERSTRRHSLKLDLKDITGLESSPAAKSLQIFLVYYLCCGCQSFTQCFYLCQGKNQNNLC